MSTPFIMHSPDYGDGFEYVEDNKGWCPVYVEISRAVYCVYVYNTWRINADINHDLESHSCFYLNAECDEQHTIVVKKITREAVDDAINYLYNNTNFFLHARRWSKKELLDTDERWKHYPEKIAFSSCFSPEVWNEILEAASCEI